MARFLVYTQRASAPSAFKFGWRFVHATDAARAIAIYPGSNTPVAAEFESSAFAAGFDSNWVRMDAKAQAWIDARVKLLTAIAPTTAAATAATPPAPSPEAAPAPLPVTAGPRKPPRTEIVQDWLERVDEKKLAVCAMDAVRAMCKGS